MVNEKIMVVALVRAGHAPTPELVDEAKRVERAAQYVDELLAALKNYETADGRLTERERREFTVAVVARAEGRA